MERHGAITFKGEPMTLVGTTPEVGETAPEFTVVGMDLQPVSLSDFKGQRVIISTVPSLDTGVCAEQTNRFNFETATLDTRVLTVSMDLPFAQKRFCMDHSIHNVVAASDYKDRTFATKYGLLIKELALIARAVFVLDRDGTIAYREIVPEVSSHPDYDSALAAVNRLS